MTGNFYQSITLCISSSNETTMRKEINQRNGGNGDIFLLNMFVLANLNPMMQNLQITLNYKGTLLLRKEKEYTLIMGRK